MTDEEISSAVPSSAPPSRDRIVLLGNASMRARRRPRAVLMLFLFEVIVGAVLMTPLASHVRSVWATHPDGDAPLFANGGLDLTMFVLDSFRVFPMFFSYAAFVAIFATLASLVPLAILLLSIAHTTADLRAPPVRQMWPRVIPAIKPLLTLLLMSTLAHAAAIFLVLIAAEKLASSLKPSWGDARADQMGILLAIVLSTGVAAIGVIHDLSRAAVVRFRHGSFAAIKAAAKAFAKAPARLLWSWGWRSGAALVPVAAVSMLSARLGGRGGFALLVLFLLHQAVILVRVMFRASWLARAMRAVDAESR